MLTDQECWTQLQVNAGLGGRGREHLGEAAVIAYAHHLGCLALLDDRAAIAQANRFEVPWHDTLWLVVEAYVRLYGRDRKRAEGVVDDLLATDMFLPVASGEALFAWAYERGLLP